MADNLIPGLHQASDCLIRRRRELPIKGRTLVLKDQFVSPDQVVAEAELPGDVQILRVSEQMGIDPQDATKGFKVSVADKVQKGDLLCEHRGLFGLFHSRFLAPSSGSIDFISESSGHLGLRQPAEILALNAYCGGRVSDVVEGYSVEVESNATLIQGIFGLGGERQGRIKLLQVGPDQVLRKESLPADFRAAILVGGTLPDIEVLRCLAEGGASGLVVGGIDDIALQQFLGFDLGLAITGNENISFSLMVTEGFGRLAISERVSALFNSHDGDFACINGSTQIRAGAIRPEVIIPTPNRKAQIESTAPKGLSVGAKVRLIRVPYFGILGEIAELPAKPQKLEAGTYARVLKVRIANGQIVTVPRANAEIIF